MKDLTPNLLDLIRSVSTDLQPDVQSALERARDSEEPGSAARGALDTILQNIQMSREMGKPICQDTGTPVFCVWHPLGYSQLALRDQIHGAVRLATEKTYLRPNAVEALSGKNTGDNIGAHFPAIHFEEWEQEHLKVGLMLKGGGSENCGCQFSIPSPELPAGRDLDGVRRAVLTTAHKAQGLGCAPGILGVGIGGDRASSMLKAKEQFFRPLGDSNPDPELDRMEKQLHREINQLGIGPMGFGGKTTVLGVKMAQLHRVPASFFVSVAYMCWADRRGAFTYQASRAEFETYDPEAA